MVYCIWSTCYIVPSTIKSQYWQKAVARCILQIWIFKDVVFAVIQSLIIECLKNVSILLSWNFLLFAKPPSSIVSSVSSFYLFLCWASFQTHCPTLTSLSPFTNIKRISFYSPSTPSLTLILFLKYFSYDGHPLWGSHIILTLHCNYQLVSLDCTLFMERIFSFV